MEWVHTIIHAAHGLVRDFSPLTGYSDLDLYAAIKYLCTGIMTGSEVLTLSMEEDRGPVARMDFKSVETR